MSKSHRPQIRNVLYEDGAGVVYRAKDGSGQKVQLRKSKPGGGKESQLQTVEQVAYQVAIERLDGIRHPSLLGVVSGGIDPEDGMPFLACEPMDGESLADRLKRGALSIELATTLLSQALEACELLSHLLGEDGIWIEAAPESILATEKFLEPRFVFWPCPIKAIHKSGAQGFQGILELTERTLNWAGREVDEREGGHLQLWLKWLKGASADTPIREVREMLAAAAGVEPPPPIEKLVEQSRSRRALLGGWPRLPALLKLQAPKMPLFALLSVMLVIQAVIGWAIVRAINDNIDEELKQLNSSYTYTPYTIDRDPNRKAERGSQPLKFD